MSRATASRYQPVLVALHWLLALLIIGLLCLGFFVLANMPNTDPKKLEILVWHMTGGMFVLVLMILRVIISCSPVGDSDRGSHRSCDLPPVCAERRPFPPHVVR